MKKKMSDSEVKEIVDNLKPESHEPEKPKKEKKGFLHSFAFAIGIALFVSIFCQNYLVANVIVQGKSMEPTVFDGERVLVNRLTVSESSIKRSEIVIITLGNKQNYIKRIIGMPGDTVEMKDDVLLINGEKTKEPYLKKSLKEAHDNSMLLTGDFGPIEVPDNHFFVMGDNRLHSMDSRNGLGLIHADNITGKSKLSLYPIPDMRLTK